MRYMLLIYQKEGIEETMTPAELARLGGDSGALTRRLAAAGRLVTAGALHPVGTATTVRVRDGQITTADGPFAETREQLAGFYVVDCANAEEAAETAIEIPAARFGAVEIRPILDFR